MTSRAFFAYPSKPDSCGDVIAAAIRGLENVLPIVPWSRCKTSGVFVIQEICREIDQADLFFADLTGVNPNVMFELGYAIAREKRVWIVLDDSYSENQRRFEKVRILTTVGYCAYRNSEDLVKAFHHERPDQSTEKTILRDIVDQRRRPKARGGCST